MSGVKPSRLAVIRPCPMPSVIEDPGLSKVTLV
jgi:hypothetical protein